MNQQFSFGQTKNNIDKTFEEQLQQIDIKNDIDQLPLDTQKDGDESNLIINNQEQNKNNKFHRQFTKNSNFQSIREKSINDLPEQYLQPSHEEINTQTNILLKTNEKITIENLTSNKKIRNKKILKRMPRMREQPISQIEQQQPKWIIMPNNKFKQIWDYLLFIILIYVSLFTPFKIGFINDGQYIVWDYIDTIIDFIFMVDIIIQFFSAVYDNEGNLLIERKQIIQMYLKGWFTIDFTSSIPITLILRDSTYNNISRISKVPKMYKMIKMIKLARMLHLNEIQYLKIVNIGIGNERYILAFFMLIFSCHVIGCLWYFIAELYEDQDWIYLYLSTYDAYIASLYWAVQTVLTVGYGDIEFEAWPTRLFAIFWMLISVYIFSYAAGSLASFLDRMDQSNQQYMNRLATLKKIRQEFKIPLKMYNKVKRELKISKNNITHMQTNTLLDLLPIIMRTELGYIMHRHIKDEILYFYNKSQRFISTIGPKLKLIKSEARDYIYQTGDHAEEIYFVKSGKLAFVLPDHSNFKFMMIKQGSYFGEIDILFYGEKRKYTVMTTKNCELYVLSRKSFKTLYLNTFREEGQQMVNEGVQRKNQLKFAYDQALQFLGENNTQRSSFPNLMSDNNLSRVIPTQNKIIEEKDEEDQEQGGVNHLDIMEYRKKITQLERQIKIKDQIIVGIQQELDELMYQIQDQTNENLFKITPLMDKQLHQKRELMLANKMKLIINKGRHSLSRPSNSLSNI